MNQKVVFTGGHHNSALAVIDWLNENHMPLFKFYWIGKKNINGTRINTPEYTEITKRRIPFYNLKAGKIFRATSFLYVPRILFEIVLIPFGFLQAIYLLVKIRPALIVSFGGYLGLPVVIAGRLLNIVSITHEQTTVLGLANLIISKFVKNVYTAWPVALYNIPLEDRKKFKYVGLPLRKSVKRSKSITRRNNHFIKAFGDDLPIIYLTGGKSGAKYLNAMMATNIEKILSKASLIWQCGRVPGQNGYEDLKSKIKKLPKIFQDRVVLRRYILENEIGDVFGAADLVISRGGAHTVYELAYLKKPCIIIPIPWVSRNEQESNAKLLSSAGIAEILNQEKVTSDDFRKTIFKMLRNLNKYKLNESLIIEANGQEKLANEIIEHLHKKS